MDFVSLAYYLGYPAAVLAVFGVAVWRVITWSLRNVAEPLVTGHLELIRSLKDALAAQTRANVAQQKAADAQTDTLNTMSAAISRLACAQEEKHP
jgi:hypothetical protein